jgi:hypothetical protein
MSATKRLRLRIEAIAPGFGLALACFLLHPMAAAQDSGEDSVRARPLLAREDVQKKNVEGVMSLPVGKGRRADFLDEQPSPDSRYIADWVVDSGDNQGMPFIIIDKVGAMAFLFGAEGQLRGAAPVLLGAALGDDSAADIGTRKLADVRPHERTTPAGRFVASLAKNLRGKEILWVDYEAGIALHRVATSNAKDRRPQRLATATPLDNRVSYGCINVPVTFYENVVSPAFTGTNGIVYVLPESRSVRKAFGSYDVQARNG